MAIKCSNCGNPTRRKNQRHCKKCHRLYMRQWRQAGCEKPKDADGKWKEGARNKAKYALKAGKIKRKTKCENCGKGGRIEMHHPDYDKPLEVKFLCRKCHKEEHCCTGNNEQPVVKTQKRSYVKRGITL